MKGMIGLMLGQPDYGEPVAEGGPYTGRAPEALNHGPRGARLPGTPEQTEAVNKAYGEGPLQSGLAFRVPMGVIYGGQTDHQDPPLHTMWGDCPLPDYHSDR